MMNNFFMYTDILPGYMPIMANGDEQLSDEEIEDMKASLDDIRAGRVRTLKEIRAGFWV
jgi:hypothetical protein